MAPSEMNHYPEEKNRIVEPFPYWYTPVKWFLPILLGLGAASVMGGFITGIIPVPQALGMMQWLPAIYGSLQGFGALAMLGVCTGLVGAFVGLSVSMLVRSTILFQVNELRATQGEICQKRINLLSDTILKQNDTIADLSEDNLYLKNFANHRNRARRASEAYPELNEFEASPAPAARRNYAQRA